MPASVIAFLEWLVRSAWGTVFAVLWGAMWGSFANVCIHRLPLGQSVVRPGSRCPSCSQPIAWFDNIPILSFLLLRGRCRHCAAAISGRYPLIEMLAALLCFLTFWRFVQHAGTDEPLALQLARCVVYGPFLLLLLVLSAIDLEHQLLPDRLTLPAIGLFFGAGRILGDVSLGDSLLGIVVGYGLVWLISEAYYRMTGRDGLGLGDGKLLALVGATLGARALPWTLLVGSVLGTLVALPVLLWRRRREPTTSIRHVAIPFGPFLSLAAAIYLLLLLGKSLDEILAYVPVY
ncbi:MAG TPA: prepilin peptidase [Pseudomonadota bacterium]|nr:prepilin peptidase [Pseudomonadota bacterium]HNK45321.1 prepilin peptidase [Pseudomonadota bacterium]HNN53383.1 prepilin peptidase [Pseudomonadota bacterium]HNO67514.1 prepilin peptidase [Pseudomonadota bacterium]